MKTKSSNGQGGPQRFTFVFPWQSPTQLKADRFLGAKILQHAPDWIFREAERWEHPWQFLLGVRKLPPACYDLFRAAESVSHAMNRIQNMLYGGATLQRDLIEEMEERRRRGDAAGVERLQTKYITRILEHGLWEEATSKLPAEKVKVLDSFKVRAERALLRRLGRKGLEPQPLPTAEERDPIGFLLVATWLRWGESGEPGLCYYSDQAMAALLTMLRNPKAGAYEQDCRVAHYRKLRQRLLLEHAYPRKPLVTGARRVPNTRLIEIEMQFREGSYRHRLFENRLVIGGRQLYPLTV